MEGWTVRELLWEQPLVLVSAWNYVALVVLICSGATESVLLLEALRHSGYDGPFLLLARQATPTLRKRAFLQGALDVLTLTGDPYSLEMRLRAALRAMRTRVSPPTP